jgi:error-prone DNA polymerase
VDYPNAEVRQVLHRTLGVPIFQEQAMRLAIVAAGFTPGEADQLRRAMGAWRKTGVIAKFHEQLVAGMTARGYEAEFAERVFRQISGFGEYGFPESHAASFALLVYVSAWLKRHYPAVFAAALINSQPMGSLRALELVRDAQQARHRVPAPDVNFSDWDCSLESSSGVR